MTETVTDKKPVVRKDEPKKPVESLATDKPRLVVTGRRATHAEIIEQQNRAREARAAERKLEQEAVKRVRTQLAAAKKG